MLVFATGVSLMAQTNSVSPYSRFGFGDLYHGLNGRFMGIGGASLASPDGRNINFDNPASYHNLALTTFDVGFELSQITQEQSVPPVNLENSRSGMRNLSVGVPIKDWWGSAFSLQPYSFKGYQINSNRVLDSDTSVAITDQFLGEGGLNTVIWGNSFVVAEGLSLGFNINYVFGSLRESTIVNFENFTFLDTRSDRESQINGWFFNYGAQYQYKLPNDYFLNAGLFFQNSIDLNSSDLSFDYTIDGNFARDTLIGGSSSEGTYTLPSELGFGLSYGKMSDNKQKAVWAVNLDYHAYNGSEFEASIGGAPLLDGYRFEIGSFINPNLLSTSGKRKGYFGDWEYRLGGFYEKTPLNLSGQDIFDYGITFGFGVPINKPNSGNPLDQKFNKANIGVVLGQRGTLANNLIREQYISFYLSVTFNDKWFIDYKYR